jgi:hypothetical protein
MICLKHEMHTKILPMNMKESVYWTYLVVVGNKILKLILSKHDMILINSGKGKGKGKFLPITGHEGPEWEQTYCCTLPSTAALDGVGGQHHASTTLPPGTTMYPLYRRIVETQGRSGRVRKILSLLGFDPRTTQPLASRYIDWAIQVHILNSGSSG